MNDTPIAFLGLGLMGSGMAGTLLEKGFPVSIYNRNPDKAKPLGERGATVAKTAAEAATGAAVIVSMLADDKASRALWLGPDGALAAAAPGTVCIECSTVTVGWIKELAAAAEQRGCVFVDAPVTGSKTQAATGELNFLVGGTESALDQARPVLDAMGRTVTHLGPAGSGAMVKLINNFVCGVQLASIAEAVAMIERCDLDREAALGVLTNGAPGSPLVKLLSARMTAEDYTPFFHLHLLAKDLSYAVQEAAALSLDLKTAETALGLFQKAVDDGYGDQDMSAVIESLRKN